MVRDDSVSRVLLECPIVQFEFGLFGAWSFFGFAVDRDVRRCSFLKWSWTKFSGSFAWFVEQGKVFACFNVSGAHLLFPCWTKKCLSSISSHVCPLLFIYPLVRKLRTFLHVAVEPAWLLYVNAFRCLGAPKGQDMVQSDERLASNSICTVLVMCRMLATFVACMDGMALWQDGATFSTLLHFFPSGQHPVGIELAHFFYHWKYDSGFNRPFDETASQQNFDKV